MDPDHSNNHMKDLGGVQGQIIMDHRNNHMKYYGMKNPNEEEEVPPAYSLGVPGPPMDPVLTFAPVQATLPTHLWPHDFFYLSLTLTLAFIFLNLVSLIPAVLALGFSIHSKSQSKAGKYEAAKSYSNIALGLLVTATFFFSIPVFLFPILYAVFIPIWIEIVNRSH